MDKARPNSAQRGYDRAWYAFRERILAERGSACVECGSTDRPHLDHIESVREAPHRRLDPTNVRVLCHPCHARRTLRDQSGWHAR
jgi:5-methylcytosine-specific restriction endonuclease McrA